MASGLRTRVLSLSLLALVFVSGAVVGGAVDRRMTDRSAAAGDGGEGAMQSAQADSASRRMPMYEQVGLREGQRVQIDSIVAHHRSSMKDLDKEFRDDYQAMRELQRQYREAYNPRYWAIVDSTRNAIKSVLDPEQAARYDSLLAENDRHRRTERPDTTSN